MEELQSYIIEKLSPYSELKLWTKIYNGNQAEIVTKGNHTTYHFKKDVISVLIQLKHNQAMKMKNMFIKKLNEGNYLYYDFDGSACGESGSIQFENSEISDKIVSVSFDITLELRDTILESIILCLT